MFSPRFFMPWASVFNNFGRKIHISKKIIIPQGYTFFTASGLSWPAILSTCCMQPARISVTSHKTPKGFYEIHKFAHLSVGSNRKFQCQVSSLKRVFNFCISSSYRFSWNYFKKLKTLTRKRLLSAQSGKYIGQINYSRFNLISRKAVQNEWLSIPMTRKDL